MNIIIAIEEKEKLEVLEIMKKFDGQQVSVAKIAAVNEINPNRTRFVVADLVAEGRLIKTLVKDYGPHYRRYVYSLPKGEK